MAAINFNRDALPDAQNFDPIPAGEYTVKIESTDVKATNTGDGEYIKLTLKVTGPSHIGRVIFANLNTRNKSPMAEQIGQGQLKSILTALNIKTLTDTDQLVGGDLTVSVGIKPAQGQYAASNEIKSYKASNGSIIQAPKASPFSPPGMPSF